MRVAPVICAVVFIAVAAAPMADASQPQVPRLASEGSRYVEYAIDNLPAHFRSGEVAALDNTPADNLLTDAGATLGRVLFYDKRLSHDGSTSCASCHQQSTGFSDANRFSEGVDGHLTDRHSMALANGGYYISGAAFWDERAESLEQQALMPIEDPREMGSSLEEVVEKLGATRFYPALFEAAFGSPEVTPDRMAKSIAQFERAMVSYQAKYDQAFAPGSTDPDFESVFTPDELAGRELFHGAGRCAGCHTTHAQVGQQATNVGLDEIVEDEGAGQGQFKTPSLRNVAVRGHFMHDGRFSTLQEVVEFYNEGVQDTPALDQSLRDPVELGLDEQEVAQLVAFLETLTDEVFLTSGLFADPFFTLPGDYSGDGVVDAADYVIWRQAVGGGGTLAADGNGDAVVDAADYTVWRDNLGRTWESPAGGNRSPHAAPEPSLLKPLLFGVVCWRRRKRGPR
ncbi:cytochrome c peroxidase [Posidoniimonas corsicana]|uniref:cytochrome c peroxidase n=1 Tax=Posidoniimonas corsicana TaxID=1938618 RepID=UPI0018D2E673|nr:cytochrome c peroxidase [Posidoniimonas corsicana]